MLRAVRERRHLDTLEDSIGPREMMHARSHPGDQQHTKQSGLARPAFLSDPPIRHQPHDDRQGGRSLGEMVKITGHQPDQSHLEAQESHQKAQGKIDLLS